MDVIGQVQADNTHVWTIIIIPQLTQAKPFCPARPTFVYGTNGAVDIQ